jgi:hypothetical protein
MLQLTWAWLAAHALSAKAWVASKLPVVWARLKAFAMRLFYFAKNLTKRQPKIHVPEKSNFQVRERAPVSERAARRRQLSSEPRNVKRNSLWKPSSKHFAVLVVLAIAGASLAMVAKSRHMKASPAAQATEAPAAKEPQVKVQKAATKPKAIIETADPTALIDQPDNTELADFSELYDKTFFGSQAVEHPQTFLVKMSSPITRLQGVATDQGFIVTIPKSLSLTDASVISKGNALVEYAAIINYGDYSRLTVKFVRGAKPEYRVRATGTNLEISIANPAT